MGDKKPGKGKKPKGGGKGPKVQNQTNVKQGGHQQHSGRGR
tara:strand:- start:638 stop:760 length:123 start_codon:yes stop_codon:yes gene_type:complete